MSELKTLTGGKVSKSRNRHKSRELVLKAVYRSFLNKEDPQHILLELTEDDDYQHADTKYFRKLFNAVITQIPQLDHALIEFLDRPIVELSPIEHAVLSISAYEMIYDASIPFRVVINEGVELAKSYGGTDGHKYVNGVLDKLANRYRAAEINLQHS